MTSNNKTSSLTLHADQDGLHTYRYQPHTRIRVTLMETEGVYITARMFISLSPLNMIGGNNVITPVVPSSAQQFTNTTTNNNNNYVNNSHAVIAPPPSSQSQTPHFSTSSVMSWNASSVSVVNGGSGPGAAVIGYRYGNLFRRGFFFNNNGLWV